MESFSQQKTGLTLPNNPEWIWCGERETAEHQRQQAHSQRGVEGKERLPIIWFINSGSASANLMS